MRVLILSHSFNSLTQRIFLELRRWGHTVSVEFDINDAVTREAVAAFEPDVVVAPFLKRAIPEDIWRSVLCWIIHPGIRGDRGPSSLDWAIARGVKRWGVVLLQANAEMDAGDIWGERTFSMRAATKSSIYRHEVTEAAVDLLRQALDDLPRYRAGAFHPQPQRLGDPAAKGKLEPPMRQSDRQIEWETMGTESIVRLIRASDGAPGVLTCLPQLPEVPLYLYGAQEEDDATLAEREARPGFVIAQRHGAVLIRTVDGAVWIAQMKRKRRPDEPDPTFKQAAATVLRERGGEAVAGDRRSVREIAARRPVEQPWARPLGRTACDIWYEEQGDVGHLYFDFDNGALGVDRCERLLAAYRYAQGRQTRVLVLRGGRDFWSNGIDLNVIEAAPSPAEASWESIVAINRLAEAIITTDGQLTVSALWGNAGAGGVFLALGADVVVARRGGVLNPHYQTLGGLYGSEFWTYVLPRRCGEREARRITESRLPMGPHEASELGLVDHVLPNAAQEFDAELRALCEQLCACTQRFERALAEKSQRRIEDESTKKLATYGTEELERMRLSFFGFDPSYHVARYNFVCKIPRSRTPLYLATHRL